MEGVGVSDEEQILVAISLIRKVPPQSDVLVVIQSGAALARPMKDSSPGGGYATFCDEVDFASLVDRRQLLTTESVAVVLRGKGSLMITFAGFRR